ncbi:27825_t:CDS:1, partial [Gigaspora margarita]
MAVLVTSMMKFTTGETKLQQKSALAILTQKRTKLLTITTMPIP